MNIKTEFETFLDQIKTHILDLLEAEGYETTGAIRCINPNHKDSNPSLLVGQAKERGWTIWCSGCSHRYDIFDVYATLHQKPSRGPQWMKEVVIPLAERFGITPPVIELNPEQQFTCDLYRIYEDVTGLLNHDIERMNASPREYIEKKEWTRETLEHFDIGTLPFEILQSKISQEDRSRFGLDRTDVFDSNSLIFAVRDSLGRPMRFFSRRPEGNKSKFTSTSSNNMMVDLWRDKGILYGAHLIKKEIPAALLVEGQPDVVTAYQAGIRNVVGLCGCNSFSEFHADSLALQGISKITVAFDGDVAGQTATRKLLKRHFAKSEGLYYEVLPLPDDHDPDSYIRQEGIEQFKSLLKNMRISAFEFLLSLRNPNDPLEVISKELIPHIASNSSEILREKMARELSFFLNGEVSVSSILADVRRIDNLTSTKMMEKRKSIIKATTRMAENNPGEAEEVYKQGLERLQEIDKRDNSSLDIRNKVLTRIQATKMAEEKRVAGGFEVTPGRMTNLTDILEGGSWRGKRLIIIGAIQNMGKSSFADDLMWQIVSNPANNAIGYWLTLDDSVEDRQRRLQCCAIGHPNFTMNMISNPHYYAEECGMKNVYEIREASYAKLVEQVASGRIIIEGSQDGTTVSYTIKRIQQLRRENPNKNILLCLDNLHDLEDYPSMEQRTRVTNIIKTIRKRIVDAERVTAICTAEYRKGDPEVPGTDEDLADCITDDMEIINYDTGKTETIAAISPGARVYTVDTKRFSVVPGTITKKFDKGIQKCYRITLDNNLSIEGTCNHPLLREDGKWIQLRNMMEGITIATLSEKKNNLSWNKVKSVEEIGRKHTWDIEVGNTHNFVANGIFCHNSRSLKFAPHLTIHLFSDCGTGKITPEEALMVHTYGGEIRPRIIANIGKNKITKFKGKRIYFDFHPESSLFLSVPREVAIADIKERKNYLNSVQSKEASQGEES